MKFQMCLLLFVATPHHLHNTGRHPAISHSTFPPGGVPFAGQWLKGLTYLLMPFSRMGACFSIRSWIMMVCYYMLHWLTNIDLYCQTWLPLIFLGQVMCCSSSFSWFLWTMRNHWGVLLNFSILPEKLGSRFIGKKPLALPVGHLGWRASDVMLGRKPKGDAAPLATVARKPSGSAKKRKWQEELSGSADLYWEFCFWFFFVFYVCWIWMWLWRQL